MANLSKVFAQCRYSVSVCIPYTAGEQYEGSSHLVTLLQNRAVRDREEFVGDLLARGDTTAAKQIPPILHSFTMIFYSRDSKVSGMTSRREAV